MERGITADEEVRLNNLTKRPQMHAQRVAQFEHYCIHNCLSPKELHRDIQEVYLPQYASACTFIYTRHGVQRPRPRRSAEYDEHRSLTCQGGRCPARRSCEAHSLIQHRRL